MLLVLLYRSSKGDELMLPFVPFHHKEKKTFCFTEDCRQVIILGSNQDEAVSYGQS